MSLEVGHPSRTALRSETEVKPCQQIQMSPLVTAVSEQGQGPAEGWGGAMVPAPCRGVSAALGTWGLSEDTQHWRVPMVGKSQQRGCLDSTIPTTAVSTMRQSSFKPSEQPRVTEWNCGDFHFSLSKDWLSLLHEMQLDHSKPS